MIKLHICNPITRDAGIKLQFTVKKALISTVTINTKWVLLIGDIAIEHR